MSLWLKYIDCFTAVVDKVKILIKTVAASWRGFATHEREKRILANEEAQGSPAFQHIALVSDSARRESSASSGVGTISWVVHL